MGTLRLFFALETPEPIRSAMADLSHKMQEAHADVRWEHRDKLHCTVKFLGETAESVLPSIVATATGIARNAGPLTVRYRGIGAFPSPRSPRVIWVGMEEQSGGLISLAREVEVALQPLGFAAEKRGFHPHVTLGRVRTDRNAANLTRAMEKCTFESAPVILTSLHLIRSTLHPSGSVYTTLHTFPFGVR